MATSFDSLVKPFQRIFFQFLGHAAARRRVGRVAPACTHHISAQVELLEKRELLSAVSAISQMQAHPTYVVDHATVTNATAPYNPSQIASAYGFNKTSNNGSGQTIAIVDAYNDPTIQSDLQLFDSTFGLANPPSLKVMSQTGSTTALPSTDSTKGWEVEESLDVEWAHALAPGASIVLVEANSASYSDLFTAVQMAANLPGVSVVSMSFGGAEFSSESSYNSVFTTPSGHQGVTFVASTGDNGAPGGFPAYSSNVLAVGGTSLTIDSNGNYVSESGWSGSGGGVSSYESQPSYQSGTVTQSTTARAMPDVSFDADPNTGVYVVDTFSNGSSNPWEAVGGTSFAAPAWGALISIIDQARVSNGQGTLDGATQTLPMIYQIDKSDPAAFRDVTTGNNGYSAGTGYDLVTGVGTPVVNVLVADMTSSSSSSPPSSPPSSNTKLAIKTSPTTGVAGATLSALTVNVENQNGTIATSDTSTVTLTLSSGTFSNGSATASVAAVNGVATFSGLQITASGAYTITASDSASSATVTSNKLTITPGAASSLSIQQSPTTGTAGQALSPTIKIAALDQYGNLVSASTAVTLTLSSGTFSNHSTKAVAYTSSGVATFTNMIFSAAGSYTLTASTASLSGPSLSIAVSPNVASKLLWQTSPVTSTVAGTTLSTMTVLIEDAYGNIITSDNSSMNLTLSTGSFSSGSSSASANVVNGVATFSGLAINTAGNYRLSATDSEVTTSISSSLVVTPAALSSLTVQQSPTSGVAGTAMSGVVKVAAYDQYGNLVSAATTVTLSLASGTFASGSNTMTAVTSHGVATFSGVKINTTGSYTVTAQVGNVSSSSFSLTITSAMGKTPVWQTAPDSTLVAGGTLDPIVVAAQDAYGNLVTGNTNVTLKLTGGRFSNGATTVTATTSAGYATFSGLMINASGSYTLAAYVGSTATSAASLTVTASSAAQLAWKSAPVTKLVAGTTLNSIAVAIEDSLGNVEASDHSTVTLTLNGGTFSSGSATATATAVNGIATFSNLAITASGTYTITASDTASPSGLTSNNVVVSPAALSSLSFLQNPTTAVAGQALNPVIQVAALDQYGNPVSTSTAVTLTLSSGTFSNKAVKVTANTNHGIATFTNLEFTTAGNYTLTASTSSMSGPSFSVAVSPGAPSKMVWQTALGTTSVAGSSLGTAVIAIEDSYGNIVQSDNSTVTLTLSTGNFSSGSSTATANAVNGIATFSGLAINTAGNYRISASESEMSAILSASVSVTPAALSSLTVQQSPTTGTAGMTLSGIIKVAAYDQYGNLISASTTVTLSLGSGTFASGSHSMTALTSHGVASFTGLIMDVSGSYTITASVGSVTSSSFNVTINAGVAKQVVWQTAPDTTLTAGSTLDPIVVELLDAYGNVATTSTTFVTLKLTGGKFSNGATSASVASVDGLATFSGLTINNTGSYTLTATLGTSTTTTKTLSVS